MRGFHEMLKKFMNDYNKYFMGEDKTWTRGPWTPTGPPLWTGSMDHFRGPGPWTPCHGPGLLWTVFFNNEK